MKRLTKSGSNIVLTGTLAGIAEYLNIDPTIIRVIYVIITFLGIGSPVFLYILLAIFIPSAKSGSNYRSRPYQYHSSNQKGQQKKERKEAEKIDEDDWSDF